MSPEQRHPVGPDFFRTVVETSPDGVFLADREGRYLYVNRAACEMTGYAESELLRRSVADLHGDADPSASLDHFARVREQGRAVGEYPFRHRSGERRWWRVDAFRIGDDRFVGLVRDVTEQRHTAAELQRQQSRLQRAQQVAAVGWWELDLDQGVVVGSDVAREIYGLSDGQELTVQDIRGIPLPEYREPLDRALQALVEEGRPYDQEFEIRRPVDGDRRRVASLAEYDPDQRRVFGVLQDITHLRRTEAALQESEARLRQAQKMEAVGRLAGGVAHDFNNLLTPILGFAELVQQDLPADDRRRADLGAVIRAGERARDLTSQLLAFGRKQMLQMRSLDLNAVIRQSEPMLRRLLRENVRLHVDLADGLGTVRADLSQVHNVLINLVVNAADAMPEGGDLTIETANAELDQGYAAAHPGSRPGPHVMLAVSDTGEGMDEQTLSLVFEPFFTTKGQDQGTGLGLATVHGIVKQHAGSIYAYSEPGQGSIFKVYLPRVAAAAEEIDGEQSPQDLTGDERVLVVEDDEAVRDLAQAVLRKHGYCVTAVATPHEALACADSRAEPLDLLLTDVVMPGMNGAQLREEMVRRWPGLPTLFMSGYTTNVIAHHGILTEGVHFLPKPFTPSGLAASVREVLDG